MSDSIGLSELIEKVKEEISTPPKSDQVFLVDKVELEIHVAVQKNVKIDAEGSLEGKAELKLTVLNWDFLNLGKTEVDANIKSSIAGELNRQDIHTIKLTLLPAYKDEKFMAMLTPEEDSKSKEVTKKILYRGSDKQSGLYEDI
jgi:hypothetical protein